MGTQVVMLESMYTVESNDEDYTVMEIFDDMCFNTAFDNANHVGKVQLNVDRFEIATVSGYA